MIIYFRKLVWFSVLFWNCSGKPLESIINIWIVECWRKTMTHHSQHGIKTTQSLQTCINKSSWVWLAIVLVFVWQRDLDNARDMILRSGYAKSMFCDQLWRSNATVLIKFIHSCSCNEVATWLNARIVPKYTSIPSTKLSPMIITVVPPAVQPSLGLMAFITGTEEAEKGEYCEFVIEEGMFAILYRLAGRIVWHPQYRHHNPHLPTW